MHSNSSDLDEIDYNLYPALVQVFAIILLGYFAGNLQILTKEQVSGLNKFVSTFSLPCLIFKNLAVVNFNTVNWLFVTSVFLSKVFLFLLAFSITLFALRPINIGMAAVFGIFVSQSNDFALGYPILKAIYSQTHPEYLDYIYLLAPISLVVINPIAFLLMEANELMASRAKCQKDSQSDSDSVNSSDSDNKDSDNKDSDKLDQVAISGNVSNGKSNLTDLSKFGLLKCTLWATISNPIVFMTIIGLVSNMVLSQHLPRLIEPILSTVANSFSALALFYLGYTMVGKIKNLTFSSVVIILILVLTKSLINPLVNREALIHLSELINFTQPNNSDIDSLSSFSFLYGTFPTAPSLFVFISRYKSLGDSLISAAVVLGTIASAPLMMMSGKMISLKYNDSTVSNFEDIECKTAYAFSFLTWFCCLWVLYVFVAAGRVFKKPHLFTFYLIVSQMVLAVIHVVWSNIATSKLGLDPIYSLIHMGFGIFVEFTTRCLPLTIILNLMTISGLDRLNTSGLFMILVKISKSELLVYGIGFVLPFLATIVCLLVGKIPDKLSMIIRLSKSQIIVSNILLFFILIFVFYLLLIFVKTKNENNNYYRLIGRNGNNNLINPLISHTNQSHNSFNDIDIESEQEVSRLTIETNFPTTEHDLKFLYEENQIMNHLSLIIILTFNSLLYITKNNYRIPSFDYAARF
ncbi:hypothetical protein BpHYR1_032378 [Brachionus plicatilis]|uniref:Integral membrane protein GPR155 n=1 Tax=Brachionus plicatilis TaxID=10195 RepID=A0A3M7SGQ3_BRAPC|nr:hypothetical protein BpHYR1_032378 [Brachionus plicatilis]